MRISTFQALTLLAQKYKGNAPELYTQLKIIYLSGVTKPEHNMMLAELLKDDVLKSYKVCSDRATINEDPVRRYFESHLAHDTLLSVIDQLDLNLLIAHNNSLEAFCSEWMLNDVDVVYKNIKMDASTNKEFYAAINMLRQEHSFPSFKPINDEKRWKERKTKLEFIVLALYLSLIVVINKQNAGPLLEVYNHIGSPFLTEHRGRRKKLDSSYEPQKIYPHSLGIMRSYMPLGRDDLLFSETIATYIRPCERNSYAYEEFEITKTLFATLVNPFISSISGTILTQIRCIASLYTINQLAFTQENAPQIINFFKALIGFFIYFSGGHGLKEFTDPLVIPKVQEYFALYPPFKSLNLDNLFCTDNEAAFEQAVEKTIKYNTRYLQSKKMLTELRQKFAQYQTRFKIQQMLTLNAKKEQISAMIGKTIDSLTEITRFTFANLLRFIPKTIARKKNKLAHVLLVQLLLIQEQLQQLSHLDPMLQLERDVFRLVAYANSKMKMISPTSTGKLASILGLFTEKTRIVNTTNNLENPKFLELAKSVVSCNIW